MRWWQLLAFGVVCMEIGRMNKSKMWVFAGILWIISGAIEMVRWDAK